MSEIRDLLDAAAGGPPGRPDHDEIRRRGRRLIAARVAGVLGVMVLAVGLAAGLVLQLTTEEPTPPLVEEPTPAPTPHGQGSDCWVETDIEPRLEDMSETSSEEIEAVQRQARMDEEFARDDVERKRDRLEEARSEGGEDERRAERRLEATERNHRAAQLRVQRFEQLEEDERSETGARWVAREDGRIVAVVYLRVFDGPDGSSGWRATSHRALLDGELCRELEEQRQRMDEERLEHRDP